MHGTPDPHAEEGLRSAPDDYRFAAAALGLSRHRAFSSFVVRRNVFVVA
jgi:ABC-type phosphate transport system permease subunit